MSPTCLYFLDTVEQTLTHYGQPQYAPQMSAYMKHQFSFLGIKKPIRDAVLKPMIKALMQTEPKSYGEVARALWNLPEREYHYTSLDIIVAAKKFWNSDHIDLCEQLICEKSWWDTVDLIASNLLGKYLINHPESLRQKIADWSSSENMWLNRIAILVQLKYRKQTDTDLLEQAILPHLSSKEFFHQKAIGWALREYAKTNPAWVLQQCESWPLAALSRREALKHL